jgi:GDA1/CD39 (nucleoside phosphatase) family
MIIVFHIISVTSIFYWHRATGTVPLVGALDMGGTSTQLIFYTGDETNIEISPENFWSHSWLNFGVDKVREKVVQYVIAEGTNHASTEETESGLVVVHNPCFFQGYDLLMDTGLVVRGSGDSMKCMSILKEILWPDNSCENSNETDENGVFLPKKPCYIDGVEHPPIRGHFYGMSVYFFAIDSVRHLGSKALFSWFVIWVFVLILLLYTNFIRMYTVHTHLECYT